MLEQFTKFANVRVEDIPAGFSYSVRDGWGVAYRSPEKIKSLNGQMEYHYIHEWTMHARTRRFLIREEYFGAKVEWTKYEIANGSVCLMESSSGKNMKTVVENEGKASLAYVSLDFDIDTAEKQSQQSGDKIVSADEKLDKIIDRLDVLEVKLLAKFPGEYRLDMDGAGADDAGTPLQWFGAIPDEAAEPDTIRFYGIEENGVVSKRGEWHVSDRTVKIIKDEDGYVVHKLPPNTEYRIVRPPANLGHGIGYGILNIRYSN